MIVLLLAASSVSLLVVGAAFWTSLIPVGAGAHLIGSAFAAAGVADALVAAWLANRR